MSPWRPIPGAKLESKATVPQKNQHLVVAADPVRYAAKLRFNRESAKRRRARARAAGISLYKNFKPRSVLKRKANRFITNRLFRGTLKKGRCVFCGAENAQAHHEDYSKPNCIVWLCLEHHWDVHARRLTVKPSQITVLDGMETYRARAALPRYKEVA